LSRKSGKGAGGAPEELLVGGAASNPLFDLRPRSKKFPFLPVGPAAPGRRFG